MGLKYSKASKHGLLLSNMNWREKLHSLEYGFSWFKYSCSIRTPARTKLWLVATATVVNFPLPGFSWDIQKLGAVLKRFLGVITLSLFLTHRLVLCFPQIAVLIDLINTGAEERMIFIHTLQAT
jgi:hypothetical protein